MSQFSRALAVYIDTMANPAADFSQEYVAAERVCAAIETKAQAQIAFDSMDDASRIMGNHVVENATDSASHPHESEGCAYIVLDDDSAIWAEWDSYGFWSVSFMTESEAYQEMEGMTRAYEIEEEEDDSEFGPDHDETHWAY